MYAMSVKSSRPYANKVFIIFPSRLFIWFSFVFNYFVDFYYFFFFISKAFRFSQTVIHYTAAGELRENGKKSNDITIYSYTCTHVYIYIYTAEEYLNRCRRALSWRNLSQSRCGRTIYFCSTTLRRWVEKKNYNYTIFLFYFRVERSRRFLSAVYI